MNRNGVVGEAADCNVCDGVTKDPDGDGVNEDLIYVNCGSGSDNSSCGAPGAPCKTINYAWNTRADGPGDGAEDIICFTGVCKTEENVLPGKNGVAGTHTVAAKGSQVRTWKYATDPTMLVGWDKDNDGAYPPFDTDDVAVLDGGPNALDRAFWHKRAAMYLEYAHFTVKDYGRTTNATESIGFLTLAANAGAESSYIHIHDLSLLNINKDKPKNSNVQTFNHFPGTAERMTYVSISNVQCLECGGYFGRGGFRAGPDISGPLRMQNITFTAHGCNESGAGVCPDSPGTKAAASIAKLWGWVDGVEILDSVFNANVAAWDQAERGPTYAIGMSQCSNDWDIINNDFIDWKTSISASPADSSSTCDTRRTKDIRIERNLVRNPMSPRPYGEISSITLDGGGSSRNETVENAVIANNFISSATGYRGCITVHTGYNSSCTSHGGQIIIVNNTCDGSVSNSKTAAIAIGNALGTDMRCPHDTFVVKNNIVSGLSSGMRNIGTTYAPKSWSANNNVYDPDGTLQWNDATTSSLSTWRQASGGDAASKFCAVSLVNRLASDLHLKSSDVCAIDFGADLATITRVDIDGGVRPGGTAWDAGADEFGVGTGTVIPPPPPPPPPPEDEAPPAPVLLDVVPLPE